MESCGRNNLVRYLRRGRMLVTPPVGAWQIEVSAWRFPGGRGRFSYGGSFCARVLSQYRFGRNATDASIAEEARSRGRSADGVEHTRDGSIVAARRSFRQASVLHQCPVCAGRAIR